MRLTEGLSLATERLLSPMYLRGGEWVTGAGVIRATTSP